MRRLETVQCLEKFKGHTAPIFSVAFYAHAHNQFASESEDGTVIIWSELFP
jgi:WD40 repeat protein